MTKYLLAIVVTLILVGCSAQKEIGKESTSIKTKTGEKQKLNNAALEYFINGSIEEIKGNHAAAILEFQDALRLEPEAGIYYALAKNYLALKKLSLARQNAIKSIELEPHQTAFYDLLADIYSSAHELDSAAVVLKNVIKLDSTDINAYYILARIYELSKPMEAINIYNRLTSIIGPDWNVLIHVTNLYVKLGKYAEAAGTINKLLTISPSNTSLEKLQADYYGRAKMYKKALFAINDVLEFLPNDLDAHQRKAEIFIAQDKWKKAAKEYSFIIKQNNVSFRTKLQIGASYFNQALKDSTLFPIVHKFFKTIEKDTSSWQTKMYLGAIAIAQKNDSIAVKDFKIALKLAKWNVEPWVRLGGLYFDNHKYNAAIKLLKGAFKSFPEDFRVNLILGLSLAQKGNNKDARKYLKRAVEVNPKDITALSAYGYTLSRLKENEEAIKYLKKALVISPNNINLLSTLGLIYDSESKWALCDSVYQKALSIDPTNALVLNNYAYSLSERGIKLDSALNMAKKAIKAEPKNSSYLDTVGWIYYRLKEYQNAKEYVQKAVQIGGHDSVMLEHLGDINYKLGQKEKALNLWKKAFKMDTTNKKLKLKIEKGKI